MRIGYFSGTLTHQSDFRMIAPVLIRLLEEFPALMLTVAGDFDLGQFPEFTEFADRVEKRPFVDWRHLPAEIARVDINLIPLVINAFTEGKSELKYYESALVEVPSVASPTLVYQSVIKYGTNGFLARTSDDWYTALRAMIVDSGLRRRVGKQAHSHAIEHYAPRSHCKSRSSGRIAVFCRTTGDALVSREANRLSLFWWRTWNEPSGTASRL